MLRTRIAGAGLVAIVLVLLSRQAGALADDSALCDQAAHRAARMSGVPLDILMAVTRAETGRSNGRTVIPWPWTINIAGQGGWFDTSQEALAQAEEALQDGKTNFDIGCFQLNYRWHGAEFASLESMFDPERNADYAAAFLSDLHRKTGSWTEAVEQYHSKTDVLAKKYLSRIEALLGGDLMDMARADPSGAVPEVAVALGENLFPLLQPGDPGAMGSLVPKTPSRGALFAAKS